MPEGCVVRLISAEQLLKERELHSFTDASVFGAMSEASILQLLQNGRIHAVKQGENIFMQGQPGDSFHVILDGKISYYKYHEHRYCYIRDYNPGEQIGFVSMIALHDRVGRAEACRDSMTLEIDSALFHDFHNSNTLDFGILMMNLAREMARTISSINNLLVEREAVTHSA